MSKKLICLISTVLVLGLFSNASAELIGHWMFDEGSGDVAFDSSGNGNDGTIHGAQSVPGVGGSALEFDGVDDYVETPITDVPVDGTVAAWVNTIHGDVRQAVFSSHNSEEFRLQLNYRPGTGGPTKGLLGLNVLYNTLTASTDIGSEMYDGSWHHAAFVWEGGSPGIIRAYWDGQEKPVTYGSQNAWEGNYNRTAVHVIGREDLNNNNYFFAGQIDDVRMYDHALPEIEIQAVMNNAGGKWPFAFGPTPKDGALHEDTWVSLSWGSGGFAASHDVYLGDDFDVVKNTTRDSDVFRANQTATFYVAGFPGFAYPDGLVPGTTYYWRIDEVNETDPNSPWKGDVWSFSIPPKTAYNPDPADGAEFVDPNNTTFSWTPGFGAKLHTVYLGDDYDNVDIATGGSPQGSATYSPSPLERERVYYWRVDEFDAVETHKGDIWSFTTPGAVGNPQPAYGATDAGMNAILSWTPSDSAASHQLYFGTDKESVRTAAAGSPDDKGSVALGAESYDPGLLEAGTTYYWRVDEVDAQGNVSTGPLWIFTTGSFLLVEDFESYTDDAAAGEAIWQTWIDGFGVADNGAQVGYLMPPYAEQTIVHGGDQSMPLSYTNEAGVTNSEASRTLTAPKDWTQAGVTELSFWFRGASANAAEPLYAAISNAVGAPAVVAYDDEAAATSSRWTEWRIALQAFANQGIDLINVDKIAIGLGSKGGMASAGGSGTIYIDGIRLYRPTP